MPSQDIKEYEIPLDVNKGKLIRMEAIVDEATREMPYIEVSMELGFDGMVVSSRHDACEITYDTAKNALIIKCED
jgi:hypothetical protein